MTDSRALRVAERRWWGAAQRSDSGGKEVRKVWRATHYSIPARSKPRSPQVAAQREVVMLSSQRANCMARFSRESRRHWFWKRHSGWLGTSDEKPLSETCLTSLVMRSEMRCWNGMGATKARRKRFARRHVSRDEAASGRPPMAKEVTHVAGAALLGVGRVTGATEEALGRVDLDARVEVRLGACGERTTVRQLVDQRTSRDRRDLPQ